MPHNLSCPKRELHRQVVTQRFGKVAHRLKAFGPAFEDPFANLRSAEGRLAALGEPGLQRFPEARVKQMLHSCMIDAAFLLPSVQTNMTKRMRLSIYSSVGRWHEPALSGAP